MPGFEVSATCRAPADEIWALLYDASRFDEWWVGTDHAEATADGAMVYREIDPDVAVPMNLRSGADRSRVTVSCLVRDVVWEWTLEPDPEGCRVQLRVQMSGEEGHLLEFQREQMHRSVRNLVALAELSDRG